MGRPHLSHVGVFAINVDVLQAFYSSVFGLVITDRGVGKTFKNELIFMTGDPEHHHQIVISSGRAPESPSTIMQLSFKVDEIQDLRDARDKAMASGATNLIGLNHGNSWSIYFDDPEGNKVEVYKDTAYHTPQPCGEKLNLDQPDESLLAETEAMVGTLPGTMLRPLFSAELAARMGRSA